MKSVFIIAIVTVVLLIPTTIHAQQCNMPDILKYNFLDVQKGGDYSNCDFQEYHFEYCEYCDFENSKLTVNSMFNDLSNSYFKNSDLSDSNFSGTNLSNSVFINADLSNSQIATGISHYRENIDFTGANLKDSTISSLYSSWTDSVFKNVNLNGAIISLRVDGLDFSGSDWTNADVIHDGYFKNSNLSKGIFKGTYFIDTTFTNVDFSDSDFDNAIFYNVILDNVDFSNSKIENAVFYNVDLSKTNIQYVSEISIPERNVFCDRHESCNLLDWYEAPKVEHLNNNESTTNIETSEFEKIATEPTLVASTSLGIASFVDQTKDPQHYIDRYNNEPAYKEWFDENYPQYSSIYQAVGLEEPVIEKISETNVDHLSLGDQITGPGAGYTDESFHENLMKIAATEKYREACMEQYWIIKSYEYDDSVSSHDYNNAILKYSWELRCDKTEKIWFVEPGFIGNKKNIDSQEIIEEPNIVCGTGTIENAQGQCVAEQKTSSKGGGCLIATATYGSELAPQVQQLRELRDNQLLQTESGAAFMNTFNEIYYSFSPSIADYERENPYFKEAVKLAITPMISTLSLMENAESESEVLGIGISVIMLNLGMYFGVPAIVVVGIRKIK